MLDFVTIGVLSSEVKDQVPFVAVRVELSISEVRLQLRVSQVVRGEGEVVGALDDRIVGSIEVDGRVVEIPTSELRASDVDNAVLAVSEED